MVELDYVKKQINEDITQAAVMVYSKSYCPYCVEAKELLKYAGVKYNVFELDKMDSG